jgi:hypothetical protein
MNARLWALEQSIHLLYQVSHRCKLFQASLKDPVDGNLPRSLSLSQFSQPYFSETDQKARQIYKEEKS